MTHCPAHADGSPSLNISERGGRTLWHCHAGCAQDDVREALVRAGLYPAAPVAPIAQPRHAAAPRSNGRIVAIYDYRDENGRLLFQQVRKEPKSFVHRRPDGRGGWRYDMDGVRRVLYRLPELLAAPLAAPVFIVEGEKDADRLAALGGDVVAIDGGASNWQPETHAPPLAGRRCIIIPDNDEPGEAFAATVARSLFGSATRVQLLRLPGLPPKGDVSDWLDAGYSVWELAALADAAPDWQPTLTGAPALLAELDRLAEQAQQHERIRRWLVEHGPQLDTDERQGLRDVLSRTYRFPRQDFAELCRGGRRAGGRSEGPATPALAPDDGWLCVEGHTAFYVHPERGEVRRATSESGRTTHHLAWCPAVLAYGAAPGAEPGAAQWFTLGVRQFAGDDEEGRLSEPVRCYWRDVRSGDVWEHFPAAAGSEGRENKAMLADLVRQLAGRLAPTAAYTAPGWEDSAAGAVYVSGEATIGAAGVVDAVTMFSPSLQRFALPAPPEGDALREAFTRTLALLDVAPLAVTAPIFAAAWLAPLRGLLGEELPDFAVWTYGPSGAFKSELAALAQAHFGAFTRQSLPGHFDDTANAVEALTHGARDALVVFDDYRGGASIAEGHQLDSTMSRLLRSSGNGSGRNRMARDLTLREERPPHCTVLATAERLPQQQSTIARAFVVPVPPGSVDLAALTEAQTRRSAYRAAMAGYVRWLAGQAATLRDTLPARFRELRNAAYQRGGHAREPGQAAHIYLAIEQFTACACAAGALDVATREQLLRAVWDVLLRLADEQAQEMAAQTPAQRFLDLLGGLFTSRRVYVTTRDGGEPLDPGMWGWEPFTSVANGGAAYTDYRKPSGGLRIGALDGDAVLLLRDDTFSAVSDAAKSSGAPLGIDAATLWRRLDEAGLIFVEDERHRAVPARIDGRLQRVIKLRVDALEADGDDSPSDEPPPQPPLAPEPQSEPPSPRPDFAAQDTERGRDSERLYLTGYVLRLAAAAKYPMLRGDSYMLESSPESYTAFCERETVARLHAVGFALEELAAAAQGEAAGAAERESLAVPVSALLDHRGAWQARGYKLVLLAPCPLCGGAEHVYARVERTYQCARCTAPPENEPTPEPSAARRSSKAAPSARPRSDDKRALGPLAVLGAEGLWHVQTWTKAGDVGIRAEHLEQLPRSVGELLDLAEREELRGGQLWLHRSYLDAVGLPASARNWKPDAWGAGLAHPFAADAGGWDVQPRGELRWWLHAFRRGTFGAIDLVTPAYNAWKAEWRSWEAAPDARTLACALAYARDALGSGVQRGPGKTGTELMRLVHDSPHGLTIEAPAELPPPALVPATEQDLVWRRELTPDERGRAFVHAYDRNAAYLAATSSLALGAGSATHSTEQVRFDAKRPGYWRAAVALPERGLLPPLRAHLGRAVALDAEQWYTTPALEWLVQQGAAVDLREAYVWEQHHRALEPWYKRLRDARAAFGTQKPPYSEAAATAVARNAVKAIYTVAIGWLSSTEGERQGTDLFRPDWRHAIVAQARVNLLRNADKLAVPPFMVGVDCLYIASDEPDAVTAAAQLDVTLGDGLGAFKVKDAVVPMTDLLAVYDAKGATVNSVQVWLNRRRGEADS